MAEVIIIAHNIRSTHNIGSIFRSAEGFGVKKIILSGYSPYPRIPYDTRLPHIVDKLTKQIHKTALNAETLVDFEYQSVPKINELKKLGFEIVGLEQDPNSIPIKIYQPASKVALLVGEEVDGINRELLAKCDKIIEIPMVGQKESFNVSVATGIALFCLTSR